jgi:hypothetical protein
MPIHSPEYILFLHSGFFDARIFFLKLSSSRKLVIGEGVNFVDFRRAQAEHGNYAETTYRVESWDALKDVSHPSSSRPRVAST